MARTPRKSAAFEVGDVVRIRKAPRFLAHPNAARIVGQLAVIIEQGSYEERWIVYCDGQRVSLHSNHIERPTATSD